MLRGTEFAAAQGMPRKLLIRDSRLPYHVTARTNGRKDFSVPLSIVWRILCRELALAVEKKGAAVHALVLMPNHFHLLISTPQANLGEVMHLVMTGVAKGINRESREIGHVFGGPYCRAIVNSMLYYAHGYKYVYRNPVVARLCDRVEEYEFSSLRAEYELEALPFPMKRPLMPLDSWIEAQNVRQRREWLNQEVPREALNRIRVRLKSGLFVQEEDPRSRAYEPELMKIL